MSFVEREQKMFHTRQDLLELWKYCKIEWWI